MDIYIYIYICMYVYGRIRLFVDKCIVCIYDRPTVRPTDPLTSQLLIDFAAGLMQDSNFL